MPCTLLIPNLLWPRDAGDEPYRDLDVPALTRLLARGHCVPCAAMGMEAWLCSAFEVERQHDWPVAPLTLALDGGAPGTAYWLRCDPVHLRAQRAQLQLIPGSELALTPDEARALVTTLNSHFASEELVFHAPRPQRWYLGLDHVPALITHALPEVAGKDINRFLPAGDGRLRWHRLLNEIQMLWHEHPVNQARDSRGEPAVNSVWLWGGGVKPAVRGRPFDSVWSDDALALALAGASDISAQALADGAGPLIAHAAHGAERQLAALPQLRAAACGGDVDRWRATLQALERDWFAPLHEALREGRLANLAVVMLNAEQCRRYDVTRAGLRKFWRRLRPLVEHA